MCSDCAICWYADGGCLAGMRDDLFVIAEKEQIIKRLDNSQYEKHNRLMKETLIREYLYDYDNRRDIVVK